MHRQTMQTMTKRIFATNSSLVCHLPMKVSAHDMSIIGDINAKRLGRQLDPTQREWLMWCYERQW